MKSTSEVCKSNRTTKVVYVVGEEGDLSKTEAEMKKFGDVEILPGYAQKYYSDRARKTQLSIRLVVERYQFALLMKSDTDSFFFLDRLLPFFEANHMFWDVQSDSGTSIYAGDFSGTGAKPITKKGHKWEDQIYTNRTGMSVYPRHAKGPGYVLSPDLARYIAELSETLPCCRKWAYAKVRTLPSEDVSVGFWLFPINYTSIYMDIRLAEECSDKILLDHYVKPEEMRARWQRYKASQQWCPKEKQMRAALVGPAWSSDMARAHSQENVSRLGL